MAALCCEICGGRLIGKPGGLFECDSCGMEYNTEWAKAKIQEIKGTVKVEGTVEVQGTVKVDGPVKVEGTANAESFLKRAKMYIAEKTFDKADEYVEKALDNNPECAEAYICKLMIRRKRPSLERTFDNLGSVDFCINTPEWKKAITFADSTYRSELEKFISERKAYWNRENIDIVTRHQEIAPAQNMLFARSGYLLALDMNGRTRVTTIGEYGDWAAEADGWTGILQIIALDYLIIGLRYDGTVACAVYPYDEDLVDVADRVSRWKNVRVIHAIGERGQANVVGLTTEGRMLSAWVRKEYLATYYRATDWDDVRDFVVVYMIKKHAYLGKPKIIRGDHVSFVVGITSDGNLKTTLPDDFEMYEYRNPLEYLPRNGIWKIAVRDNGRDINVLTKAEMESGDKRMIDVVLSGTSVGKLTAKGVARIGAVEERDLVSVNGYIGLKADGSVWVAQDKEKACSEIEEWRDMRAVAVVYQYNWAAAITEDGSVLLRALDDANQDEVDSESVANWKLFDNLENLKKAKESIAAKREAARKAAEKAAAKRKAVELAARKAALESEKSALLTELANLKGLFTGKRRKEIESRLAKIDAELKNL